MNDANQIGHKTHLYGFIAVEAQQNRFSVTLNRLIKANSDDAMMIPMNIREDDFYFTLTNMKKSHVNGAVLGEEFQKDVLDILDVSSPLVKQSGFCDIVVLKEGQLYGDIIASSTIVRFLEEQGAKKVAVIGAGALARALALSAASLTLSFFHESVESIMSMGAEIGIDNIDINRIAEGMQADLSAYDAVIDASTAGDLSMLSALPKLCVDLKAKKAVSALRQRCHELDANYVGYEALLPDLTMSAYNYYKEEL